ncbi:hypothetical protein G6F23_014876 [Rhizopus arrhizus]|nr:hypothetical protein G6F23_014876 [Rhizopus arrhizus]
MVPWPSLSMLSQVWPPPLACAEAAAAALVAWSAACPACAAACWACAASFCACAACCLADWAIAGMASTLPAATIRAIRGLRLRIVIRGVSYRLGGVARRVVSARHLPCHRVSESILRCDVRAHARLTTGQRACISTLVRAE